MPMYQQTDAATDIFNDHIESHFVTQTNAWPVQYQRIPANKIASCHRYDRFFITAYSITISRWYCLLIWGYIAINIAIRRKQRITAKAGDITRIRRAQTRHGAQTGI